jgi:hypothetical protein
MGRRIFVIGLGPIEDDRHPRELAGLLQPPYSKEHFQLLRDKVWDSFLDEGIIKTLGDLKLEKVLRIEATNASNVFIEQFYYCFPEPDYFDILSDSNGTYWLANEQMKILLNHLLEICEIFYPEELEPPLSPEIGIKTGTEMEAWAAELFDQEWTKRVQDPNAYEAKWGADYFNFSLLQEQIFKGLKRSEAYPYFIVFDA